MDIDPLRAELNEAAAVADSAPGEPRKPWVLFGSTVMLLHGLRDHVGDVDVFVSHRVWEQLAVTWRVRAPHPTDPPYLERLVGGVVVNAFYTWTPRDPEVIPEECRQAAELVRGWWCTPLPIIRKHKEKGSWHPDPCFAKHRRDIAVLDAYLQPAATAARPLERRGTASPVGSSREVRG